MCSPQGRQFRNYKNFQGNLNAFVEQKHLNNISEEAQEARRRQNRSSQIFPKICRKLLTQEIELFASSLSHQLKKYIWKLDPLSHGKDAMEQDWLKEVVHAFFHSQ